MDEHDPRYAPDPEEEYRLTRIEYIALWLIIAATLGFTGTLIYGFIEMMS